MSSASEEAPSATHSEIEIVASKGRLPRYRVTLEAAMVASGRYDEDQARALVKEMARENNPTAQEVLDAQTRAKVSKSVTGLE